MQGQQSLAVLTAMLRTQGLGRGRCAGAGELKPGTFTLRATAKAPLRGQAGWETHPLAKLSTP